jgi:WD40 repeat protein
MGFWLRPHGGIHFWSVPDSSVIAHIPFAGETMTSLSTNRRVLTTMTWPTVSEPRARLQIWDLHQEAAKNLGQLEVDGIRIGDMPNTSLAVTDSTGKWLVFARGRTLQRVPVATMGHAASQSIGRHEGTIVGIAMHPDNERVASIDLTGRVCLWSLDPSTDAPLRILQGRESPIGPWFDPQGRWLATSFGDGRIHLWDLLGPPSAQPLELRRNGRQVQALAFHPSGEWLAAMGGPDPTLWRIPQRFPVEWKECSTGYANHGLAFTANGAWLAAVCGESLHLFSLFPDHEDRRFHAFENSAVWGIDVDPTQRYVFAWDVNGCRLIDFHQGRVRPLPGPPVALSGAIGPHGRLVASGHWDDSGNENHAIRVHDLESNEVLQLGQENAKVDELHFTPDGSLLASSGGTLSRWNLETMNRQEILREIQDFDLSRDGRRVVAIRQEKAILYDLQQGTTQVLSDGSDPVRRVTFDKTGRLIVTGHASGRICVHSPGRREPYLIFAHEGPIVGLTVHPNGDWIASTAEEEEPVIRLWPMPPSETFHDRPLPEFLDFLRACTNLRIVPDATTSSGYSFEFAEFPGWQ